MSRLPALTGKQLLAVLQQLGFETIRVKGSHHFSATRMAEPQWFLSMPGKPLALDC